MVKRFNMTNIDAMMAYEKFFKKYPNGEITKEQFMEVRKKNTFTLYVHSLHLFIVRKTRKTL